MNARAKKANEATKTMTTTETTKRPEPTPLENAARIATFYGDRAKEDAVNERAAIVKEWRWAANAMLSALADAEKDATRSLYGIGEAACRLDQLKERATKMDAKAESIRRLQDIIDALADATLPNPMWTCPDCGRECDPIKRDDGGLECRKCGAIVGPKEQR